MTMQTHLGRTLTVAACLALSVLFLSPGAIWGEPGADDADSHNRQGMAYFNEGFHGHAPQKRAEEAERQYGLAEREFRAAIARDPSHVAAHRNLARVFQVRKNYAGAAEEYRRVTELEPGDLTAYVNLALVLIELQRPDEAVAALENAKGQTDDPRVRKTLDSYISRVRAHQGNGVR